MIKLNSIPRYSHISDDYLIEDTSFLPKVINAKTGEELHWQQSGTSFRTIYVVKKDGKNTCISSEVISEEYDNRHPW